MYVRAKTGRNDPVVANGVVEKPWIKRFGETITISCNRGYAAVPGWGLTEPECIPRDDCHWAEPTDDSNGTTPRCDLSLCASRTQTVTAQMVPLPAVTYLLCVRLKYETVVCCSR
eukprot:1115098-Rhodomonas_salina.2